MEETCTEKGCSNPVTSRGLCSAHYQKARYHNQLPEAPARACEHCGTEFKSTRQDTRYCSAKCKNAARHAKLRAATAERHAARKCENCGGPIPLAAGGNAQTCSRKCSVALQNMKRAEGRQAAWLATDPRCSQCGNPITNSRRAGVKYCSEECKRRAMSARWRERAPHYMRLYLYGVTQDRYLATLAAQDGRCAICRTDEWGGRDGTPHTDHDSSCCPSGRACGKCFRGILCANCNNGLGMFGHDPARLRAAADYLEKAITT